MLSASLMVSVICGLLQVVGFFVLFSNIVLAIPAVLGWALPYICYVNIRKKKIAKVAPLIGSKHDEIYEVCLKANSLLAGA